MYDVWETVYDVWETLTVYDVWETLCMMYDLKIIFKNYSRFSLTYNHRHAQVHSGKLSLTSEKNLKYY